ncbi:MAG: DJ-1/PfpI family protein [Bacteroidaceae bacterium]|nr:DJ-1/PfpI family protein [Bacteroidaceae bacterium]
MNVYLLLAEGFETIEALAPVDILRRGGIKVKTVSVSNKPYVKSSHGITVAADTLLSKLNISEASALILPGGFPGYKHLCDNPQVGELARQQFEEGRLLALICGAPTVLKQFGIATGRSITCHSSVISEMSDYTYTGKDVEHDGNLITANGAAHAVDFGLEILRTLAGEEAALKVARGMQL